MVSDDVVHFPGDPRTFFKDRPARHLQLVRRTCWARASRARPEVAMASSAKVVALRQIVTIAGLTHPGPTQIEVGTSMRAHIHQSTGRC